VKNRSDLKPRLTLCHSAKPGPREAPAKDPKTTRIVGLLCCDAPKPTPETDSESVARNRNGSLHA